MRSCRMRRQDQYNYRRKRDTPTSGGHLAAMFAIPILIGVGGVAVESGAVNLPFSILGAGCDIKGNISISSGERIYHVPGQKYYDDTVIRSEYGERWFCSEAEARKAGWRKSVV